ncbi:MAG: putative toxin-antitoxin system toxin component, PIN family [Anaerolineae bacterium]|nr:putative toxin-antitoxin system toxin component, PIN family [Anaerolineae bacterium]NUQ05380.1 putative toxin-antitoxin system toxin component, PIN family [Anaerolineae bacterium]
MTYAVVLDTNVYISATFWDGTSRKLVNLILDGEAELLTSEAILGEFEEKLQAKKLARYLARLDRPPGDIVNDFRESAQIIVPVDVPEDAVADPKDLIILACAVSGKADYIVSGDHHLLDLKTYQKIVIVTPAEFLAILTPPPEAPSDDTQSE